MILQFAFRELRNQPKLSLLFTLSLAVGLSAFLLVDSFRVGIETSLNSKAKNILAADIGFGARRALTSDEVEGAERVFTGIIDRSQVIESYSMVASKNQSRLVQLKAIEGNYPFYGQIELKDYGVADTSKYDELQAKSIVWMYPEILLQLGVSEGDMLRIGQQDFIVAGTIVNDSSGMGTGFSFAPPVYLSKRSMDKTQLLGLGSRAYYSYLYKLRDEVNAESLAEKLFQHFEDPAVQVLTPKSSSEQVGRILGYLGDYMGLASLIAIFLTAFGCGYLYRSYLSERMRDVALYKSLGLNDTQVERLYCYHVVFLSAAALLPLLLLTQVLSPQLSQLASDLAGAEIVLGLHVRTVALGICVALLGGLLSTYPIIRGLRRTQAKTLLAGGVQSFNATELIHYLPLAILYIGLSMFLSQSYIVGSVFLAGVVGSLFFLFGLSVLTVKILGWVSDQGGFRRKWIIRSITRNPSSYQSGFISLSIGVLLTLLLPQLEHGLLKEIDLGSRSHRPNLFLFDIQQDQNEDLQNWMIQRQVKVQANSPMIRARLVTVNGREFDKGVRESLTREQERENRFRNRGFNLTYRESLSTSESLLEGDFWDKPFLGDGLPEISIETRFADRLGLKVGDVLEFEIQGVPIVGQITSRRKVRWTSFQPNFFVQFQPGVLEDAPGTFLMTLGDLSLDAKTSLQNDLVKDFPNVSVVDVSRIVERIGLIVSQVSLALEVMAFIALAVGFLIFYAIVQRRNYEKRYQANLLRSLGASVGQVTETYIGEFVILCASALVFGAFMSLTAVFFLAKFVFDGAFAVNSSLLVLSILGIAAMSLTIVAFSLRSLFKQSPKSLLQESSEQAS